MFSLGVIFYNLVNFNEPFPDASIIKRYEQMKQEKYGRPITKGQKLKKKKK